MAVGALLLLGAAISPPLKADDVGTWDKRRPCSEGQTSGTSWLDETQDVVSSTLCRNAAWLDSFFGNELGDENPRSQLRIKNSFTLEDVDGLTNKFSSSVGARAYLPSANKRLKLILESDEDQQLGGNINNNLDQSFDTTPQESGVRAGVRYQKDNFWDFDLGIRRKGGVKAIMQARHKNVFTIDEVSQLRFRQTFFGMVTYGFGEETQFNYERLVIDRSHVFVWSNRLEWTELTRGLAAQSFVGLLHQENRQVATEVLLGYSMQTWPVPMVNNFNLTYRYRRNLYKDWLFIEYEPEINFPAAYDRRPIPKFTLHLDVVFGEE
ncbi:MAG TPA: hypothetical protein VFM46_04320 [Pseudomonadales bacterium]|nr:hypothetical protein [Pseudomonadales bacterium]